MFRRVRSEDRMSAKPEGFCCIGRYCGPQNPSSRPHLLARSQKLPGRHEHDDLFLLGRLPL